MRLVARTLTLLCLAALLASPALAEKKKEKPKADPNAAAFALPKTIKLDAAQQTKLDDLKKEYGPRLTELNQKFAKIVTPERRTAQAEARKAAQAEGKKGKELQAAVMAALKLTPEEETQFKELQQTRTKLNREIKQKLTDLLTDEQKEQLKPKPKPKPNLSLNRAKARSNPRCSKPSWRSITSAIACRRCSS